jgi:hypothetical protein
MISKETMERIGNEIDILCNVDVNYQNVVQYLLKAAKEKATGSVTAAAARLLGKVLNKGDVGIIVTGFPLLDWLPGTECIAETDGPPGAAVLARAIDKGFDAIPIIVSTASMAKYCEGSCHGVGFIVTNLERALRSKPSPNAFATSVTAFPTEENEAQRSAEELIDRLKPKVLIAVEQPGSNEKGVFHFSNGGRIAPKFVAKADVLFKEAKSRGIATIGIGDRGNELGMANIKDTIKRDVPFGSKCICSCQGGIAASTEVDLLVSAAISNWGAYGIAAAVSSLSGKHEAFPSANVVRGALDGCVRVGSGDGSTGIVESTEDGVSIDASMGLLAMMKSVVDWAEKTTETF